VAAGRCRFPMENAYSHNKALTSLRGELLELSIADSSMGSKRISNALIVENLDVL
jgi:hypothetical protein